jgi:hypothetical protein
MMKVSVSLHILPQMQEQETNSAKYLFLLHYCYPCILTLVRLTAVHATFYTVTGKLKRLSTFLNTYRFPTKLNKELFPLEWDFNNFGPRKGVYANIILEHHKTRWCHAKMYVPTCCVLEHTSTFLQPSITCQHLPFKYLDLEICTLYWPN